MPDPRVIGGDPGQGFLLLPVKATWK